MSEIELGWFVGKAIKNSAEPEEMVERYEIGMPCYTKGMVGRIVGKSDRATEGEIDGRKYPSIVLFSTPHGTVLETGILHLYKIDAEGLIKLRQYELTARNEMDEDKLYAGRININTITSGERVYRFEVQKL